MKPMNIYHVVVFVDTTCELVKRPIKAASPLEARKLFLQEMRRTESIVRIEAA